MVEAKPYRGRRISGGVGMLVGARWRAKAAPGVRDAPAPASGLPRNAPLAVLVGARPPPFTRAAHSGSVGCMFAFVARTVTSQPLACPARVGNAANNNNRLAPSRGPTA